MWDSCLAVSTRQYKYNTIYYCHPQLNHGPRRRIYLPTITNSWCILGSWNFTYCTIAHSQGIWFSVLSPQLGHHNPHNQDQAHGRQGRAGILIRVEAELLARCLLHHKLHQSIHNIGWGGLIAFLQLMHDTHVHVFDGSVKKRFPIIEWILNIILILADQLPWRNG